MMKLKVESVKLRGGKAALLVVCVDKAVDPYKWKLDVLEVDDGVRAEIMRRCSVEGH